MNSKSIALIIVAAGSSTRMGGQTKKEYLPLNNGTVLSTVALTFLKSNQIKRITVVIPQKGQKEASEAFYKDDDVSAFVSKNNIKVNFIEGDKTRQGSVYNALDFLDSDTSTKPDYVLIHDGARPFLSTDLVTRSIQYTVKYGASVPAINPVDTQKEIDSSGFINRHLIRKNIKAVQTPQGFEFAEILKCHKQAKIDNQEYTDDTEVYDLYSGKKTFVFDGEQENKKITYKEDIPENSSEISSKEKIMLRTGIGYDKHRLVENRKLMLGGIEVPFDKGEDGHSDGDAVLHAITDALLGASHKGDIGSYFPDTDPKYKDADSKKLLSSAWDDVKNDGWKLENLDIVILLEKPKFLSYRNQVIHSIAETLEVNDEKIFIKAKTGEKLGDVGNGNCIEVFANCLLSK